MRLHITRSANSECFYIVESIRKDGKNTSRVVEKLGNLSQVKAKAGNQDPYEWAREYARRLTENQKKGEETVVHRFSPSELIPKGEVQRFNGGYLFLQKLYSELKLQDICKAIKRRHSFDYDLNAILSRLVFCRIIKPLSKSGTFEYSQNLLEAPNFDLHQIYRALDVLADESDYIQERLYLNSKTVVERKSEVLYYDCTNYFFEIEEEKGIRTYGVSKENRPLPIVEMGLLMDGNGIPLAFCIHEGKKSEQTTLKPLEEMILKDFDLAEFIVCTDAGLSSSNNKYFNSRQKRDFITAASVKKLPKERRERLLQPSGWKLVGENGMSKQFDLDELERNGEGKSAFYDKTFYKEEWFTDTVDVYDDELGKTVKRDLTQRLIITFSFKYRSYLRAIRDGRIDRAKKLMEQGEKAIKRKGRNDVREFIREISCTDNGEIAEHHVYSLNDKAIADAEAYDGFYAVYTSLDANKYPVSKINQINHGRWEIEECFRIMKSEFEARPVYLQRDNRIKSHFLVCYIALIILRILEVKTDRRIPYTKLISCLSEMDFVKLPGTGFIPAYTRNEITDSLHEIFGFRTDHTVISQSNMKKIFTLTKKA